jgi:hypothetical protein
MFALKLSPTQALSVLDALESYLRHQNEIRDQLLRENPGDPELVCEDVAQHLRQVRNAAKILARMVDSES